MQIGFLLVLAGSVSIMIGSFTLIVCLSKEGKGVRNTEKWGVDNFLFLWHQSVSLCFFPSNHKANRTREI